MQTHFPGCKKNTQTTTPDDFDTLYERQVNDSNNFITVKKLKWSIGTFNPNKAAGPDGIKPLVMRQLGPILLERLVYLYQGSLQLQYVPEKFCISKVIFIPKPGKASYSKPKSYRPISLTSVLFKTLERIVLHEIEENTLRENPLNRNQHAFRNCLLYTSPSPRDRG